MPLVFPENRSSSRGTYEQNSDSDTEEVVTDEYSSDSETPKIILIQAKVMKMTKSDIYAISRLLLILKPKRFGLKYLYYIFPHNVCSDVYLFIFILIFIRYVPREQKFL